jgi:polyisoprenoid-binding protein YceI
MKNMISRVFWVFWVISTLFSCKNQPPVETEAPITAPDTIRVEEVPTEGARVFAVTEGVVYWSASKAVGGPHNGTLRVKSGELLVNRDRLLRGTILLDMPSITVGQMKDNAERNNLEAHLKDTDFFDVAQYPTGEFTFEEVLPSNLPAFNWVLSGQLTLKGKTNPVNIPVKLTVSGDRLEAETPTFPINRTQWGINFRSGALGTAKDKLIEDVIALSIKLSAEGQ